MRVHSQKSIDSQEHAAGRTSAEQHGSAEDRIGHQHRSCGKGHQFDTVNRNGKDAIEQLAQLQNYGKGQQKRCIAPARAKQPVDQPRIDL